mmetsp:Transcript_20778/g.45749  ORF Transcript_20778/g.45749 Transcript_20778/m.45749 type:complete len:1304 (-) Transcript_20778:173-4084(-)
MGNQCNSHDESASQVEFTGNRLQSKTRGLPILPVEQVPTLTSKSTATVGTNGDEDYGFSKAEEDVVCLAWSLTPYQGRKADCKSLTRLHVEISQCLAVFGAELLADEATSGMIRGHDMNSAGMNAADALVRLGQCLCRWASAQTPPFQLQVGVHIGQLLSLKLPNSGDKIGYFGDAVTKAKELAAAMGDEVMVHLSGAARDALKALGSVQFITMPSRNSFLLDPGTEVTSQMSETYSERGSTNKGQFNRQKTAWSMNFFGRQTSNEPTVMTLEEFSDYLTKHNVDVSQFGVGSAKPLRDFYEAVIVDQKSYLLSEGNRLERVVDLVRISLRMRDSEGKLRELKLVSKDDHGRIRARNQLLGMVINVPQHGRWQEVVEKCFETRFDLSVRTQKACFQIDMSSYTYKEERSKSETIPGIPTTYKAHTIAINIKDRTRRELKKIGLPAGETFTTETGSGQRSWAWCTVQDTADEKLMSLLQRHGIDVSEFSPHAFAELYDEVYETMTSNLEVVAGKLVRMVRVIKVWLHADILNTDHTLVMRSKLQRGEYSDYNHGQPISMRMSAEMGWEEAVEEALLQRVGITLQQQQEGLVVDFVSYKMTEETATSRSYPGLTTVYTVNEVTVRVMNSSSRSWRDIGLPDGTDFSFGRRETVSIGDPDTIITRFGWTPADEVRTTGRPGEPTLRDEAPLPLNKPDYEKRKVTPMSFWSDADVGEDGSSGPIISHLMKGKKTDWTTAKIAAARIRDPTYTCGQFYKDITSSFPELGLYCYQSEAVHPTTSSGRTVDDEYQRTIGALFAVFWLMRLDHDGKGSFCYGLDNNWIPRVMPDSKDWPDQSDEWQKRKSFMEKTDWAMLTRLCANAGLLKQNGTHDAHRTLAMLVLMAIHDIMKLERLVPVVGNHLKEFCGYECGERIADHDIALSYVMQHLPEALPSFHGLDKSQQDCIRFAQCKLEYNMGWLVQAEAPPGALFSTFKKVVSSGQSTSEDICFYFVHWFADLAGSEPFPLEGCEKFVLKFPQRVLGQFVDSCSVVSRLSHHSETRVFEDYLIWRWARLTPDLGPPPSMEGAIARMRLVVMAQGDSQAVLQAFDGLSGDDKRVLSIEMARTGCVGQCFLRERATELPLPETQSLEAETPLSRAHSLDGNEADDHLREGPAILIYYSPALMQKGGSVDPQGAMMVLAEVFRAARALWPASAADAGSFVTVRIDALKDLPISSILHAHQPGVSWILSRTSARDASVDQLPIDQFRNLDWTKAQVFKFEQLEKPKTGGSWPSQRKRGGSLYSYIRGSVGHLKRRGGSKEMLKV